MNIPFFKRSARKPAEHVDVLLIGAGIMSATLGTMLRELCPELTIEIFERMDSVAAESSSAWNNAGTGHAANCELNYTPEREDGTIDVSKALVVNESFEVSKQFWATMVQRGIIQDPRTFINNVPHMSFVTGEANVAYLRKRYEALSKQILFEGMQYSDDPAQIREWIPLVMEGRDPAQKVAATRMEAGTDVNFGSLTKQLLDHLSASENTSVHLSTEIQDLRRGDSGWVVTARNLETNERTVVTAKFVFIGAGGGAITLLEKADIPEARGFGGFPVGGEWLVTMNPELVAQHEAKVYGKPALGAPPMSVPHLDTRVIDGKKALLFGPFATFSTKFLKNGSWFDLPNSLRLSNLLPLTGAGLHNLPLTKYLVEQLLLSPEQRMDALREYFPKARANDWKLQRAGQRVQVIKDVPGKGGVLEFGTEVVSSADGSISALLGASPGASTSAEIMLGVIEKSFATRFKTPELQQKLKAMVPTFGLKLHEHPELVHRVRRETAEALKLSHSLPSTVPV